MAGGKDLLLKVNTTGTTFVTLGGLRSKTMTVNAESIDITSHDSDQMRTLLDGAGIRSMDLSGSGIHTGDAATLDFVDDKALAQTLTKFQIVDDSGGRTYEASFKITSFERAGEYNAEQTYSISLESSGAITVT